MLGYSYTYNIIFKIFPPPLPVKNSWNVPAGSTLHLIAADIHIGVESHLFVDI